MCGRSACTLGKDDIQKACRHQTKNGKFSKPRWIDPPGGQSYQPSHNVCPGNYTPILLSKSHIDYEKAKYSKTSTETKVKKEETESTEVKKEETEKDGKSLESEIDRNTLKSETKTDDDDNDDDNGSTWVIQPMQWGLVPCWHSGGSTKGVGYNMINARSDGILSKRTFKGPLEKGRRCVVLVDGYFEWQNKDGKKQPYFVYFPHNPASKDKDCDKQTEDGEEIPEGWEGKRLLTLAGLFDVWRPKDGSPPVFSYSIITVDAHKSMSWLHDRMPAILDGEDEVSAWLDAGEVPLTKAVKELIRPRSNLSYHPVSSAVGNNKNKSDECTKPIDLEKIKKEDKASSNFMKSWLTKKKRKSTEDTSDLAETEGATASKKARAEDSAKDKDKMDDN